MSEEADAPSGWYRESMSRLHDADDVIDFAPVGPRDSPEVPDYISVKLARGKDSEVLNDILGYENYVILSAYVGDSGELIIDITNPERISLFKHL